MVFYILLRLFCKSVLAKLLLKCKKFMLTSINIYYQKLIINRFLICYIYILFCTLMSRSIIYEISLVFRLMSNILNACWSESNDQKNRYHFILFFITISLNFLIPRSKYMLHNVTQSWGISGCVSWQITQSNNSYSSMNSQQMSIYLIENMTKHRLKLHFMNIDNWNAAKDDQFFLHISSMILSHERLNIKHFHKNYLKISSRKSYYQCATLLQAYVR